MLSQSDSRSDATGPNETPDPPLDHELARLGPEQAAKMVQLIRGLFTCIGDLNQRIAELEKRGAVPSRAHN